MEITCASCGHTYDIANDTVFPRGHYAFICDDCLLVKRTVRIALIVVAVVVGVIAYSILG